MSGWGDHGADPDPGLDTDGWAQARAAAEALQALPQDRRPVSVVSSPLRRCRETAQPFALALGAEVMVDPAVSEIPTPSGIAAAARPDWLRAAFAGTWPQISGDLDYAQWRDAVGRAVLRHPGAAVFSHFVAINAAVSFAVGDDRVRQFEPGHASITAFEIVGDRLILTNLGASAVSQVL